MLRGGRLNLTHDLGVVAAKSQMPVLEFDAGQRLTEDPAIAQDIAGWGQPVGVDISRLKNFSAFMACVAARPAVQEAMKAEGLLKS